jgi:hypothetical protein
VFEFRESSKPASKEAVCVCVCSTPGTRLAWKCVQCVFYGTIKKASLQRGGSRIAKGTNRQKAKDRKRCDDIDEGHL